MDAIRKPTHLEASEMKALLSKICPVGIRSAIAAWAEGKRPANIDKFRPATRWVIVDDAKKEYPHRPLISLACELCGERVMDPNNFGLDNDNICKEWLEGRKGFSVGYL